MRVFSFFAAVQEVSLVPASGGAGGAPGPAGAAASVPSTLLAEGRPLCPGWGCCGSLSKLESRGLLSVT